jgi:hypothetical protein
VQIDFSLLARGELFVEVYFDICQSCYSGKQKLKLKHRIFSVSPEHVFGESINACFQIPQKFNHIFASGKKPDDSSLPTAVSFPPTPQGAWIKYQSVSVPNKLQYIH